MLLSGRLSGLPPAALQYPEGRLLAPLVETADRANAAESAVTGADRVLLERSGLSAAPCRTGGPCS